ncbi:MAG: hypothetical protein AB7O96_08680 [Pseudobdellovibrionaceae bacterium]
MLKVILVLTFISQISFAKDVHVKGYYRKNGTYVQPHIRSSPDSYKWNNYGSSDGSGYKDKNLRDSDKDGTPNYLDTDDNNNGISDDND